MSVPIPHNLTAFGNMSGIVGLTQVVNEQLMRNTFGILLLIAMFAITFMSFMNSTGSASRSFSASAFIAFGLCVLLRIINLVPDLTLYVTLTIAALSLVFVSKQ